MSQVANGYIMAGLGAKQDERQLRCAGRVYGSNVCQLMTVSCKITELSTEQQETEPTYRLTYPNKDGRRVSLCTRTKPGLLY